MIKVEIEINGRKIKIEADNAQDIADAVKVLAEKEKEYVPVYPAYPIYPSYPEYPKITWWGTVPPSNTSGITTSTIKASEIDQVTWTSGYVQETQN